MKKLILLFFFLTFLFEVDLALSGSNDKWVRCCPGCEYSPGNSYSGTYYCCCLDGESGWTTTYCSYPKNVNYCNKGGKSCFADVQEKDCNYRDKDNICRASGSLGPSDGCTASSECNGLTPGSSCGSGKICDSDCRCVSCKTSGQPCSSASECCTSYSSGTTCYYNPSCSGTCTFSTCDLRDTCTANELNISKQCLASGCSPQRYVCDSASHTNCRVVNCGGTSYYCTVDASVVWKWRSTPPAEVCDGYDNDCDGTVDEGCGTTITTTTTTIRTTTTTATTTTTLPDVCYVWGSNCRLRRPSITISPEIQTANGSVTFKYTIETKNNDDWYCMLYDGYSYEFELDIMRIYFSGSGGYGKLSKQSVTMWPGYTDSAELFYKVGDGAEEGDYTATIRVSRSDTCYSEATATYRVYPNKPDLLMEDIWWDERGYVWFRLKNVGNATAKGFTSILLSLGDQEVCNRGVSLIQANLNLGVGEAMVSYFSYNYTQQCTGGNIKVGVCARPPFKEWSFDNNYRIETFPCPTTSTSTTTTIRPTTTTSTSTTTTIRPTTTTSTSTTSTTTSTSTTTLPSIGSISGRVEDYNTNKPISGANVRATGPSYGSDITDSYGYYYISNLMAGSYTVTASAIGYNSQSKPAPVRGGETTVVNFALTPYCDYDNICEAGETQVCPDCKTFVSIYPTYTYPGQEVTITIYFNDSRFDVDKTNYDVQFDLSISNVPWNSTNGCDIGGKKFRAQINCGCGMGGCRNEHGYYGNSEYWVDFLDGYAKVTATCRIPTTISIGTHTLKAVPIIYSSPTVMNLAETVFIVENPVEKAFLDFQTKIISLLHRLTQVFISR